MDTKSSYSHLLSEIKKRVITQLVHFTRFENITAIVGSGEVVPRNQLHNIAYEWSELAAPNFGSRRDEPDTINTSIMHPNVYLLNYSNTQRPGRFCVIGIKPEYIYEQDTIFSITNATYKTSINFGINDNVDTFLAMFGKSVQGGRYLQHLGTREAILRSNDLCACYPTDPQAEVLIRSKILYNDFMFIACRNKYEHDLLASAFDTLDLPTEKLCVQPDLFQARK